MGVYRFECVACRQVVTKICGVKDVTCVCPQCGQEAHRLPVLTTEPSVYVTLDKYKRKKVMRNINKIMRERSRKHTLKYEVGEIIAKQGVKATLRNSSLFEKDGKIKKK